MPSKINRVDMQKQGPQKDIETIVVDPLIGFSYNQDNVLNFKFVYPFKLSIKGEFLNVIG